MNGVGARAPLGATVREARARYFDHNGFGEGGYESRWVDLQAGPFRLRFPNSQARVAAVKLHDLHHVATGYKTTWVGEGEMSAWEIAGGCGSHLAAWVLNLQAMAIGTLLAPSRMWRAFRRGRAGRTLYHGDRMEDWLDRPLDDLRESLDRAPSSAGRVLATFPSYLLFTAIALVSLASTLAIALLPLVGVAALLRWLVAS